MAELKRLNDKITMIKYKKWTFKGKDTTRTMLDMWTQGDFSTRQIGEVFNCSHNTVHLRFKKYQENQKRIQSLLKLYLLETYL